MVEVRPLPAFLNTVPLLRGLPAEDVARFARSLPAPRVYRPSPRDADSEGIYGEGNASTAIYIVLDGPVETPGSASGNISRPVVQASVEDDNLAARVRLWRVYPRDYFGELEFLAGSEVGTFPTRFTKAVALNACRVVEIPFKKLDELIGAHPVVFRRLTREAIARFQQTLEDTLASKMSDPDIALATWLVERARDFGIKEGDNVRFRKTISQEDIGKDLGVSRETMNLRLNEWRRRGLMTSTRGQPFVVRDMDRVERIAALAVARSRDEHRSAVDRVDAALASGDNFRARNFALDLLGYFPGSAELKHRAVLAVARCGATHQALSLLSRFGFGSGVSADEVDRLVRSGIVDPTSTPKARYDSFDLEEIHERIVELGEKERVATQIEDILALSPRLWKDIAFEKPKVDKKAAQEAFAQYRQIFAARGRPYTGINAASLAFVLGQREEGMELAARVLARLPPAPTTYWQLATKGEAHLLRGKTEAAIECFKAAIQAPDAFEGSIAATRLQLRRLASANIAGASDLLDVLKNRAIAVFVGQAVRGGELLAQCQAVEAAGLDVAVRKILQEQRVGHVYGGLAAGADIVVAEAALASNAALHVVLPLPVEDFVAAWVLPGDPPGAHNGSGGARWRERFEACLARAASLTIVTHKAPPARELEAALYQAWRNAIGQALLKADTLMAPCHMLALGNVPTAGAAGPVLAVNEWKAAGLSAIVLPGDWPRPPTTAVATVKTPWRPIVFAWLLSAGGNEQMTARGVTDESIERIEAMVRANVDPGTFVLRRSVGGNRPQLAFVAVPETLSAAMATAERLLRAQWREDVAVQVTLDFGPVLAASGKPSEDRLKDLDFASGPLEVPVGITVASAAFTMEARLALGQALSTIALGRVARLDTASGGVQLLPSTAIYALHEEQ